MPDDIKLLPCPFCGGDAHVFTGDGDKPRWVSCNDCEADGPHCQAVSDVIKGWNHRASLVEGLPQADNIGRCSLRDILKPLVMAEHFCEEQNCSLCRSAIKTAQELVIKNFTCHQQPQPALCQVCGGKLEFYSPKLWWFVGNCLRCTKCGRKWSNKTGPR